VITTICSVCGETGTPGRVYCQHCGGVLVQQDESGKADAGKGGKGTPEFVVGSRTPSHGKPSRKPSPLWGFFSQVFLLVKRLFFWGLLAALVAALIPPSQESASRAPIPGISGLSNPRIPLQGVFTIAEVTKATLLEGLINENLKKFGTVTWSSRLSFVSPPQWQGSRVIISQGQATYFLDLSYDGIPIYFSETFRIGGESRHWFLIPESGSIGRLPLSELFLPLLTPFIASTATPFDKELEMISHAESLELLPGKVVFSMQ